jgi:hypothetical protein
MERFSMDIRELLASAQREVDEAAVADDLRAVAFGKALDWLAEDAGGPKTRKPETRHRRRDGREGEVESPLERIADKLSVDLSRVQDVYFEDGEKLGIGVSTGKLKSGKKGGTEQLAVLVAAGRQAGGYDDGWTHSREIRDVCTHFGKFDVGNFGKTLSGMGDYFQIKGKGQQREVKVKVPGYEEAARLINELTGGEGK